MEPYADEAVWLVVVSFLVAFLLAFGIGANDVANSFGTSVGSKVLSVKAACILATIFEMAGAILIGYKVSDTMRKGILDVTLYKGSEKELMLGCLSSLIGSGIWLMAATFLKLPISGTHSIVGATVGFSLVCHGLDGLHLSTLATIVASWFVSPLLSGIMSATLFKAIHTLILKAENPLTPALRALPFIYLATVAINVFSIVHDGPKLLYLDNIPLWMSVAISVGIGLLTAIVVQLVFVPSQRKRVIAADPSLDNYNIYGVSTPLTSPPNYFSNSKLWTRSSPSPERMRILNQMYPGISHKWATTNLVQETRPSSNVDLFGSTKLPSLNFVYKDAYIRTILNMVSELRKRNSQKSVESALGLSFLSLFIQGMDFQDCNLKTPSCRFWLLSCLRRQPMHVDYRYLSVKRPRITKNIRNFSQSILKEDLRKSSNRDVQFTFGESTDSSRDGSPRNSRLLEEGVAARNLPVIVEVPANNNGYVLAQSESLSDIQTTDKKAEKDLAPKLNLPNNGNVTPAYGLSPNSSAVPLIKEKPIEPMQIENQASNEDRPEIARVFSFLQILTACFGSFAHGGNDVSNAIGPLIAVWLIFIEGSVMQESETPIFTLIYGGIGISVGLWVWGRRVIQTIGEDLTKITPSTGFTIEIGAALTVLLASKIGLPISTTHCKVGSVVFVGWCSSDSSGVDWALFRNIIYAWVVTVPVAGLLSAGFMAALRPLIL